MAENKSKPVKAAEAKPSCDAAVIRGLVEMIIFLDENRYYRARDYVEGLDNNSPLGKLLK